MRSIFKCGAGGGGGSYASRSARTAAATPRGVAAAPSEPSAGAGGSTTGGGAAVGFVVGAIGAALRCGRGRQQGVAASPVAEARVVGGANGRTVGALAEMTLTNATKINSLVSNDVLRCLAAPE